MDNIWDRNPSMLRVIGHCGWDFFLKRMTTQNRRQTQQKE